MLFPLMNVLSSDLDLGTTMLVITATDTQPCIKFSAVAGDTGDQETEMLTLKLTAPPNVRLENDSLTVFIKDSDGI